jgi:acyl dehydratase
MTTQAGLSKGDVRKPRVVGPLTRLDFIRYAGASGDFNPNHTIDAVAQEAGFPTVFAHGMFHAGVMGNYAADWLGASGIRRFAVKFRSQVWPDDILTITGQVSEVRHDDNAVDIELACTRQNGEVAATGQATFVLR